jgi:hypothetical protein
MRRSLREAFRGGVADALILSLLVIVPIAFLGPGWRTSATFDRHGSFQRQHQSLSGKKEEGGSDNFDEPRSKRPSQPDRDIPFLRAFEIERQAEAARRKPP